MDVLRAEKRLREGCSDDEIYDLVLTATGSEEKASDALAARIMNRLRRGETVEV